MSDPFEQIRPLLAQPDTFLGLTLSGPPSGSTIKRWRARPVTIRGHAVIQLVSSDGRKEQARNIDRTDWPREAAALLAMGFTHIHMQSTRGEWHIRITRRGRALISRGTAPATAGEATPAAHDRAKKYPLPLAGKDRFLEVTGIQQADGTIKPSMRSKFRQINGFIAIMEGLLTPGLRRLDIVDCGCGSALLSLAVYHYATHMKGLNVAMTGIDRNPEVIKKAGQWRDELGWTDHIQFVTGDIESFKPLVPPGLVLSLHACDTATDDALLRGMEWNAGAIVCAPCCQHELHHVIRNAIFDPVTGTHGLLRERMSDWLTDAFRALALRAAGYRVDVVEFVSPEATPKNLLLRAARTRGGEHLPSREAFRALAAFWNVRPYMGVRLGWL